MTRPDAIPVADLHNDLLSEVLHFEERGRAGRFGSYWLPQLQAGGVRYQVLPVFTEEQFVGEAALRRCLRTIELAHRLARAYSEQLVLVRTPGDIEVATASGRIALVLALEGLEPVGADLVMIEVLAELGVSVASLTWNRRTPMADGAGEPSAGGLTRLGVQAVRLMESAGMIVDVSHLNEAGFWHVADIASRPIVATHSSCRSLVDHPRNLSDDQIIAIAATGGLVGINFFGGFLGPGTGIKAVVRHVEHVIELVGDDHVGLGSDFMADVMAIDPVLTGGLVDEVTDLLKPDLLRPADFAPLSAALRGHFGADVASKICHGNAHRTLAATHMT
jgi:membrane dipeptidase